MMLLFGSGNDLLGEIVQISLQVLDAFKFFELAAIQRFDADASRFTQSFQFAGILSFALLNQPQSIAEHLAGVLVASGRYEGVNELFLVFRQHNISGWHRRLSNVDRSRSDNAMADYAIAKLTPNLKLYIQRSGGPLGRRRRIAFSQIAAGGAQARHPQRKRAGCGIAATQKGMPIRATASDSDNSLPLTVRGSSPLVSARQYAGNDLPAVPPVNAKIAVCGQQDRIVQCLGHADKTRISKAHFSSNLSTASTSSQKRYRQTTAPRRIKAARLRVPRAPNR
jgi:hypothetical protein